MPCFEESSQQFLHWKKLHDSVHIYTSTDMRVTALALVNPPQKSKI